MASAFFLTLAAMDVWRRWTSSPWKLQQYIHNGNPTRWI